MARRALRDDELENIEQNLPGWKIQNGKLFKLFKFNSFAEAMGWMVSVSIFADKIDHHPDWSNSYNKVEVELVTHDLGSISTLDVELARRMEEVASD